MTYIPSTPLTETVTNALPGETGTALPLPSMTRTSSLSEPHTAGYAEYGSVVSTNSRGVPMGREYSVGVMVTLSGTTYVHWA